MRKGSILEIKVGIFVIIGIILILVSIITLSSTGELFAYPSKYHVFFNQVNGLVTGAKVKIDGVTVGSVKDIHFEDKSNRIRVNLEVSSKFKNRIRESSKITLATQGVLVDKFIDIKSGDLKSKILSENSEIKINEETNFDQIIDEGKSLLRSINSIAISLNKVIKTFEKEGNSEQVINNIREITSSLKSILKKFDKESKNTKIKESLHHMHDILRKINNGDGSLGAIINDKVLYDDLQALIGGANRNRILRNLVRDTIQNKEK